MRILSTSSSVISSLVFNRAVAGQVGVYASSPGKWDSTSWSISGCQAGAFDEALQAGLYSNASEVVREALRLMHDRDKRDAAKLARVREEAALGFEALDRQEF